MPQRATDERSRWPESLFTFPESAFNIPESVFNLPGIRVHVRPESVFKIPRNTQYTEGDHGRPRESLHLACSYSALSSASFRCRPLVGGQGASATKIRSERA